MPDRVATDVVLQHLRRASREAGIAADALPRTSSDHREVQELIARLDGLSRSIRRGERREAAAREEQEWQERRKARVNNGK